MTEQQHDQSAEENTGPGQVAQDGQHGFGVDEDNHGWAPDSGPASEAVREGNRKACGLARSLTGMRSVRTPSL
jgi:hypothetical protein